MNHVTPANRHLRRVAPLALFLCLAAGCAGDDDGTATQSDPPPPSTATISGDTTSMPTTTTPSKSGGRATLTTAAQDIFPLLGGDIGRFAPTQVEGRSLQVLTLVGRDAFWAGRAKRRVLVKMRLKGKSPPELEVGQEVGFIGVLRPAVEGASLGVSNDADRQLLARQGAYVDVSAADVKLG
jgi:hypothetical protein